MPSSLKSKVWVAISLIVAVVGVDIGLGMTSLPYKICRRSPTVAGALTLFRTYAPEYVNGHVLDFEIGMPRVAAEELVRGKYSGSFSLYVESTSSKDRTSLRLRHKFWGYAVWLDFEADHLQKITVELHPRVVF